MKKTASILLLVVLAFNWIGYRFVSGFLEHKADVAFSAKIDHDDYDESSLIQITVPLNAPYVSGSSEFERFDGEIEMDGVHYNYVKRKIDGGNLVLLCLPNDTKSRFQNSRMDFFKLVNDLSNPSQGKEKNTGSTIKSFGPEYSEQNSSWSLAGIDLFHQRHAIANLTCSGTAHHTIPEHPPRV